MSNWWSKWGPLATLTAPAILAGVVAWLTLRADERYLQKQEFLHYWGEIKEANSVRDAQYHRDLSRIDKQLDQISMDVKQLLKERKSGL